MTLRGRRDMNKALALITTLGILAMPTMALAQEAPEGFELLAPIISAAQGGEWSLFASLLIMVLVWLATRAPLIRDWIKGEAKIWTAAVAGILASFAAAVYVEASKGGDPDWLGAVLQGLSVGLAAGGLWSLVGRKISGKAIDADGDGVLDPEE
jgi:hypothetical protein